MATRRVELGSVGERTRRNLHDLRRMRNLTLRELAERLKSSERPLPHGTLSEIERGARRIDVDDLAALAAALEVDPRALIGAEMPAERFVTAAEVQQMIAVALGGGRER